MTQTIKHVQTMWTRQLDEVNEARFDPAARSFYLYVHLPIKKEGIAELASFLDEILEHLSQQEENAIVNP